MVWNYVWHMAATCLKKAAKTGGIWESRLSSFAFCCLTSTCVTHNPGHRDLHWLSKNTAHNNLLIERFTRQWAQKIHRKKSQTFPHTSMRNAMLFQIFCWVAAHPQIFLLCSLASTSLVHQPLQGIYKAVHAALPSVHWWHPALYLLPSWPRHSCWQPQTMSARNWFLEEGQLAAAQPGQGRNNANQQGEVLWGPGEIHNCSISWGHLSGHHPKQCTMQAPGQDLTSSQAHQKIPSLFVKCLLNSERPQHLSLEFVCENCTRSLDRWPGVPLLALFWTANQNNCKPVPWCLAHPSLYGITHLEKW